MGKLTQAMKEPWTGHPDREQRLRSAIRIAEWAAGESGLYVRHLNELLSMAAWKATELDGKMRPRYRSGGVVDGELGAPVNHEHVVPRLQLRSMMLSYPEGCDEILANAVGCLVTTSEHRRLDLAGVDRFGWERYQSADITVYDMKDRSILDLSDAAIAMRQAYEGFLGPS